MNILLAILVFSIIVIVHELGHFIVAKANNVMVIEFCIGFGPRLIRFMKGETMYSLRLIPFGGACIMLGDEDGLDEVGGNSAGNEDDDSEDKEDDDTGMKKGLLEMKKKYMRYDPERSYVNKSVWARIAITVAGPLFNFLLAFVGAVIIIGSVGYDPCKVDVVYDGSPAQEAGLEKGDVITGVNGRNITFAREFNTYVYMNPKSDLNITYKRDGKTYETTVKLHYTKTQEYQVGVTINKENVIVNVYDKTPAKAAGIKSGDKIYSVNGELVGEGGNFGELLKKNPDTESEVVVIRDDKELTIKIKPELVDVERYYSGFACFGNREKVSPMETIGYGFKEIGYWVRYVFDSLGMLFGGKLSLDDVSGPVGVVSVVSQVVEQSKQDGGYYVFLNLLNMIVLLSANLGVMNLLPIPAIDGGKLVFLIIEAVRGKPVSKEKEGMVHLIGMILLMILMFVILFNDIRKIF